MREKDIHTRFWNKVDKNGPVPDAHPELGQCWVWTAAKNLDGYGCFGFEGRVQDAHRVAWKMEHGAIPQGVWLDHKCHNPACVNIAHLRECSQLQNTQNRRWNKNNTSGYKGVSWSKRNQCWDAKIQSNHKCKFLGYFKTKEEAHAAYCEAALRLHGEFANFGSEVVGG